MKTPRFAPEHRVAWSAAGAAIVLVSALAFAVPAAVAQQAAAPAAAQPAPGAAPASDADARRYIGELGDTFRFIMRNYVDLPDAKKLYEGAMKGMFEALGDPYSTFLDEKLMSEMSDLTSGEFGGVGLYIWKQPKDPKKAADQPLYIEVESPIDDTPGARFGIKAGDLIVKINGEGTEPLSSFEAQQRMRGPVGSPVVLTIRRGEAEFEAKIVRAVIQIPTVKRAIIPTPGGNVAYLRIIEFSAQTKSAFDEAIKYFDAQGYRALVLDVRNNGGGLLQSSVQIADAFLESGAIVSTRGRNPYENSANVAKPDLEVPLDKPVILLINKGTASASEILAGALKDNRRAYLVGENSFGKGSVQLPYQVDTTGYKLTIARYYTPSDENIDKTGIPPDLEVKEPPLTDAQSADLSKLFDSGELEAYAKAHPEATAEERNAFSAELGKRYVLPERALRILVKNQLARAKPSQAYDLEFDSALQAALKLFDDPAYPELLAKAKTVKELVAAKKAAAAAKGAGPAGAEPAGAKPAALPSPEPKD
jgi:carboxyl-terminal processing protease